MPSPKERTAAIGTPGKQTAILFFSHRPEREWQNKQFVRDDYATHRRVAGAFYEHSRRAAHGSGLPVLEVHGPQQRGDRFGVRLANAFADAFAQGYDRVIAVGSDCPRLHEVDWAAVVDQLADGTPVLGPTPDHDGVYLIGLTRTQFERDTFAALPWKTPALFAALEDHLADLTERAPTLLAARGDVNDHGDLVALLRSGEELPDALCARLRAALGAATPTTRTHSLASRRHVVGRRSRAPPASPSVSRPAGRPRAT